MKAPATALALALLALSACAHKTPKKARKAIVMELPKTTPGQGVPMDFLDRLEDADESVGISFSGAGSINAVHSNHGPEWTFWPIDPTPMPTTSHLESVCQPLVAIPGAQATPSHCQRPLRYSLGIRVLSSP